MNCFANASDNYLKHSPTANGRSSACATAWATVIPIRWKKWAGYLKSPANASGKSRPKRSKNCSIPYAASSSPDSSSEQQAKAGQSGAPVHILHHAVGVGRRLDAEILLILEQHLFFL